MRKLSKSLKFEYFNNVGEMSPLKRLFWITGKIFCALHVMPQQLRDHLSLNGEWEIRFDDEDQRKSKKWFISTSSLENSVKQPIIVPSYWEEFENTYEGVALYSKIFKVAGSSKGRIIKMPEHEPAQIIGGYCASFFDFCMISGFEIKDIFWNEEKYPEDDYVVEYYNSYRKPKKLLILNFKQ
jgi:hypothetical protein